MTVPTRRSFIPLETRTRSAHRAKRVVPLTGFTLIELLVVIAIIGILSAVVLASLNSARVKGNDARRYSDLNSLQLALELYYSTAGAYPAHSSDTSVTNSLSPLVSTYIPVLPHDPTPSSRNISNNLDYRYCTDGQRYALLADIEKTNTWCVINNGADPCTWSTAFPHCGS